MFYLESMALKLLSLIS